MSQSILHDVERVLNHIVGVLSDPKQLNGPIHVRAPFRDASGWKRMLTSKSQQIRIVGLLRDLAMLHALMSDQ